MSHRNARLTVHGRLLLIDRLSVRAGRLLTPLRPWGSLGSVRTVGCLVSLPRASPAW